MFQFKQFRIEQDRCAMKVGTDSILLGAWTSPPEGGRILDLGAGTGILALMMAQKEDSGQIDAVEVDEQAASQCQENIDHSPWANRIQLFTTSIQDFQPSYLYDLIISNPPFFAKDLAAEQAQRSLARQGKDLDMSTLIAQMDRLLSSKGSIFLVLPYTSLEEVLATLPAHHLFLQKVCRVQGTPRKEPSRVLLSIGREQRNLEEDRLIIQTGGANQYSEAYKSLTKDFYLDLS